MLKGSSLVRVLGLLAILSLPFAAFAGTEDGCWLRDAVAPAPTLVFALCQQGGYYVTTDAGAKWTLMDTGSPSFLRSMVFTNATHGIVVGDGGTVYTTDDGGKTWQARESKTKENLLAVTAVGNDAWAGGFDGALIHSGDGGRTWASQTSGTTLALEDIYFADKNNGWACGWSGKILRTVDGGAKWTDITTKAQWSLSSLHFVDAKNGWATGFGGQLMKTTDAGATWQLVKVPLSSWLKDVAVDKAGRIWIAADDQFLTSADGGATWTSIPAKTQTFLRKFVTVGDSMWALGQLGILRQTGSEWKDIDTLKVISKSDAKAQAARKDIDSATQQNTGAATKK
jgi:photosystem II stability/assembly factor-like uncharacterized protein